MLFGVKKMIKAYQILELVTNDIQLAVRKLQEVKRVLLRSGNLEVAQQIAKIIKILES